MDWMELLNECLHILLPAVCSIIVVVLGVVGAKIKSAYEKKCNNETTKTVIDNVVKFVEQVYKDLEGDQKLQKALTQASIILNEKGISISETELNMLIESAVYGLQKGILDNTNSISEESDEKSEDIEETVEVEEEK